MRNLFVILCLLFYSSNVFSQIKITETFDGTGVLDWNEYADKDVSAIVKMGVLDLEVKKDKFYSICSTDLPILPEYDFKITMKLIVSKINEEDISLEESFAEYQKGMELLKKCNEAIDLVEKKVLVLSEKGEMDEF